jgi:DNA-binding NtrC family response regulator
MADGLTWGMEPTMPRGFLASPGLKERVQAYERQLILDALRLAHGNQRRAAAALGCLPTTLNEKMRRLGLRACDASSEPSEPPAPESPGDQAY